MNRKEIVFWSNRYNKEEDPHNKGLEEELRNKFQKNKLVSKSDLIKIIKWKFQGRLRGRQKIILNLLTPVKDSFIKEKSSSALKIKDDEKRLNLLSSIRGVGNALSSVILAFYDPNNYGILDIHAWRALFSEEPKDLFSNRKNAIKFFNKLRKISFIVGLSCRDIEKALFKKDLEKSKI